jgi:hypothetical protein
VGHGSRDRWMSRAPPCLEGTQAHPLHQPSGSRPLRSIGASRVGGAVPYVGDAV